MLPKPPIYCSACLHRCCVCIKMLRREETLLKSSVRHSQVSSSWQDVIWLLIVIFSFSEKSHYTLSAESLLTGGVKLNTELCPAVLSSLNHDWCSCVFWSRCAASAGPSRHPLAGISGPCHGNWLSDLPTVSRGLIFFRSDDMENIFRPCHLLATSHSAIWQRKNTTGRPLEVPKVVARSCLSDCSFSPWRTSMRVTEWKCFWEAL